MLVRRWMEYEFCLLVLSLGTKMFQVLCTRYSEMSATVLPPCLVWQRRQTSTMIVVSLGYHGNTEEEQLILLWGLIDPKSGFCHLLIDPQPLALLSSSTSFLRGWSVSLPCSVCLEGTQVGGHHSFIQMLLRPANALGG